MVSTFNLLSGSDTYRERQPSRYNQRGRSIRLESPAPALEPPIHCTRSEAGRTNGFNSPTDNYLAGAAFDVCERAFPQPVQVQVHVCEDTGVVFLLIKSECFVGFIAYPALDSHQNDLTVELEKGILENTPCEITRRAGQGGRAAMMFMFDATASRFVHVSQMCRLKDNT